MKTTPREKEVIKLIQQISQRYDSGKVFQDCVAMMALSMSFLCDFTRREEREKVRASITKQYSDDEMRKFQEIFILIGDEIEDHMDTPVDVLGEIFEKLNLGNGKLGQFFTPNEIARFMGEIQLVGKMSKIEKQKWVTVCDPCVGSGALLFGLAAAMKRNKMDYRLKMVATAVDVDIRCVYMAYVQLGLYGIPAVVIHGNSLSDEEWSRWYTPVYLLDSWVWRQRCGLLDKRYLEDELIKCAQEPLYAMMRYGFDVFQECKTKQKVDEEPPEPPRPAKFDIELMEKKNGQMALF